MSLAKRRFPCPGRPRAALLLVVLAVLVAHAANGEEQPPPEGFESLEAGELGRRVTALGTWSTPEPGHAEIDPKHSHTGRQCLHVHGGRDRIAELALALEGQKPLELSFHAERWTRNAPFEFAVEAYRDEAWVELYRGDREVRVGGFLTHVTVPGVAPRERLRFRVTSPPKSGLLIDDLRLTRPAPMRVERAVAAQLVTPVLVGTAGSPVLRLSIEAAGSLEPLSVTSIQVSTAGTTDLADIETVSVFCGGERPALSARETRSPDLFDRLEPFGEALAPRETMTFRGTRTLAPGANRFWVAVRLRTGANQDHVVDASCGAVVLSNGVTLRPESPSPTGAKRIGLALRKAADNGVAAYRIPGIVTSTRGTLIAVYDCRNQGGRDLPGDIDVGMSRSTDGGRSWEPMRRIMDFPREKDPRHGNGVGDPSILVDRRRGTIWVAALWSHGNRAWHGSGPGMTPEETGQLVLTRSDDDGVTWSAPRNITRQVKDPAWRLLLQGPGMGITMSDGTLVFPAQFRDAKGVPHSTIISSRDGGETWRIGTGAKPKTTESQVVELRDGSLMLNMRDDRGGSRSVYTTRDLGRTWERHPTSRTALREPVCMASLIRFAAGDAPRNAKRDSGPLLFSNPDVARSPRRRITIKASTDDGATWPETWHLLLDEGIGAGYSCMTAIDDSTIGILYEGSQAHLVFQRVRLDAVLAGRE